MRAIRTAVALALTAASASALLSVACSDTPTLFGRPSGLRSSNLPGEAGFEQIVCDPDADLGLTPAPADAGPSDSGAAPCRVSFARDIFPNMTAEGAWKCAAQGKCHGATQPPVLNAGDASQLHTSLAAVSVQGVPYLADSGDPKGSSLLCNVSGGCGSLMPIDPGRVLTPSEVCRIEAWIRCGAPNN